MEDWFTTVTNQAQIDCLGCMLFDHLNSEKDHWKAMKQKITKDWLVDVDQQPSQAVSQATIDAGHASAVEMDIVRVKHIAKRQKAGYLFPQKISKNPYYEYSEEIHHTTHTGQW